MLQRNVGGMGERHLGAWCDEVGITANPVERDKTGWDYMLEFPLPHALADGLHPLDLAPKPIRCLVQVKATDQSEPSISVKLDNWLRMATETIPAFFLVMEYDGQPYPQRGYLVHVGELLIRAVLRRLREISTREPTTALHRQTMAVPYGPADQLVTPDGLGLEQAIRHHVGDDPHAYEDQKRRLIRTAGYEEGLGELRVRMLLRADDPEAHLVDLALGRVNGIPIEGAEFRDVRFGVAAPTAVPFGPGGELRGGQYRQDTVLRFRATNGAVARMRATVFSPKSVSGLVAPDSLRMRIANPFIDIVAGLTPETECTFSMCLPDSNELLPLADFSGFADFLVLNQREGGAPTYVELRFQLRGREVVQRIGAVQVIDELLTWANVIRAAWTLADTVGLPQDMDVTQQQLLSQAQEIRAAAAALRGEAGLFVICTPEELAPPTGETRVPWVYTVAMGEHRMVLSTALVGALAPAGSPEPGKRCYSMTPTEVMVLSDRLLLPGERFGPEDHVLALESIASSSDTRLPWRWWAPVANG